MTVAGEDVCHKCITFQCTTNIIKHKTQTGWQIVWVIHIKLFLSLNDGLNDFIYIFNILRA